jgi:hypothetical protein
MESSKKASDYFREFQYVRSRSDVEKVRGLIWRRRRRRRRRILYMRNSMEEVDKSVYGMRKAMWTIPTRSPRYLEIKSQNQNAILNATNK